MKKYLILGLLVIMALCLMGQWPSAHATVLFSGSCGENLTWELDDGGTLTISGKGKMFDFKVTHSTDNTPWAEYKQNITQVVIEDGPTNIGNSAFENCEKLITVTIADSVAIIGESAFKNCYSLSELSLGNGVAILKQEAFTACKSLQLLTLPESLTRIEKSAFAWCEGLLAVTIPDHMNYIGDSAFAWCENLLYVSLPANLPGFSGSTFSYCWSIWHVLTRGDRAYGFYHYYFENTNQHLRCTGHEITLDRTEPTCATAGSLVFTCTICQDSRSASISKIDHTWKDATCTQPRTCQSCNATKGKPLGEDHVWDEGTVIQEPTEDQPGILMHKCTVCAETKVELMENAPEAPPEPDKPLSGGAMFAIIIASLVTVIGGTGLLIWVRQRKA